MKISKKYRNKKIIWIVAIGIIVLALILGLSIGLASKSKPSPYPNSIEIKESNLKNRDVTGFLFQYQNP